MRKLTANTFASLDGVMQAPGAPGEDRSGGFTLGGWTVNYWDDAMNAIMAKAMGEPFDLLLGRRTYEIFAAFWPTATGDPAAAPLNSATKYVASRGRPPLTWDTSVLLSGDVAGAVAELKRGDGPEIQVHGSSDLLRTLWSHGLVDEYRVWTFPVVIGSGKRLFADGATPGALSLVDSSTSSSGVVISTYRPAGEIRTGSFV